MRLSPSSTFFSGLPVRDLLKSLSYKASTIDEEIALGLVFETGPATLEARQKSHLTNSTDKDHQIRFPLKDRVGRSMAKLAASVARLQGLGQQIKVHLDKEDFVSIEFFKNLPGTEIQFVAEPLSVGEPTLLTPGERQVIEWLGAADKNYSNILKKCHERMYASDYRAAYQILSQLPEKLKSADVHHMLGLCANFFGRYEEAEAHFRQGLQSNDPHARVRAAYVIAMLYLRMYEKERQNLGLAEILLEEAYETLQHHRNIPDWTFHRVFNRNGYALCLFRRNQAAEALELLDSGIQALDLSSEGANRLHQSVLIYNAVQCLRTLKRYKDCEVRCNELLQIDPYFPEYYLEQARVFLDQGKTESAFASVEKAVGLDSFIPEAHALKGYCYLQTNDFKNAAQCYRDAIALKNSDVRLKLDLGYCLSELGGEYRLELDELLESMSFLQMTEDEMNGFSALCEEGAE